MEGKDGRTERATSKRRSEERKKGNLCVSQEFTTVMVLLLGFISLRYAIPHISSQIYFLYVEVFRLPIGGTWNATTVQDWFISGAFFLSALLAPVFGPVILGSVIANMAQTGPYYSTETLHWKLGALNPVKGFKHLFSAHTAVTLVIALFKAGLVVGVIYLVVRKHVSDLYRLSALTVGDAIQWTLMLIYTFSLAVVFLFLFVAVFDWCMKKYKHEKNMMMTKKEVEDERKQQEPNPLVKRQQMKKMREFSLMRMMAAVPKASVVVTNPTHVAVALLYDSENMGAPKVVAKGLRLVAERIKRVARENGVPILERPEVARDLYKNVKVGQEIPSRLYGAIAEILAYLYKIGQGRIKHPAAKRPRESEEAAVAAERER